MASYVTSTAGNQNIIGHYNSGSKKTRGRGAGRVLSEGEDSPAYIIQGGSDHGKTELKSVVFKEGSEKGESENNATKKN